MTNIKTWQERKKEKTIGYIIRFFAVIMWGQETCPIFAEVINSKCEREEFEK